MNQVDPSGVAEVHYLNENICYIPVKVYFDVNS